MANLNRVHLIGRLTRDPEIKAVGGGKLAKIGFAVSDRKKDKASGEWKDNPVWIDVTAWDNEKGRKLATLCEDHLSKGDQAYIEGKLVLEEWTPKGGGEKRSKLCVVADNIQLLSAKGEKRQREQPSQEAPPEFQRAMAEDAIDDIPF